MTSVLVELRPAFEGWSGIPQETRLLFARLARTPGLDVSGLLQRGGALVDPGVPAAAGGVPAPGLDAEAQAERSARLVDSLVRRTRRGPVERVWRRLRLLAGSVVAVVRSRVGAPMRLGFLVEPACYGDALWSAMFAPSLGAADREAVLGARYRVLRWPWSALHAIGVATGWLRSALYPRLDTSGIDVLVAQTPFPASVAAGTRLVVHYHDAIPMLLPDTVKDRRYHRATHVQALRRNVRDGAWFACVSEATRRDLLAFAPEVADRTVTIPNMVSDDYREETRSADGVVDILRARRNPALSQGDPAAFVRGTSFLLSVGTIEPRKNHVGLVDAWQRLREQGHGALHLVIVGSLGWHCAPIVARFEPGLARGDLHALCALPSAELRLLYRHAAVTVCASFGEGFDFPGVEAMRSGGIVAASDLPVHHDVFADGCVYFDPHSPDAIAQAIAPLLAADAAGRRAALVERGRRVSERYTCDHIALQWKAFLTSVAAR